MPTKLKPEITQRDVLIGIDSTVLPGVLDLPASAESLVVFAHGTGVGRLSPRSIFVSQSLKKAGIGTLLFDLLTEDEDLIFKNRFDISLLTDRLIKTTLWLREKEFAHSLNLGYLGSSTGAAAALEASVVLGSQIKALVLRAGRPDLAMEILPKVKAPTLFIAGKKDKTLVTLNQIAYDKMRATKKIEVIPKAGHFFEEPGALQKAADLATGWFKKYLR